jgi:hypothetical protein
VPARGGEREEGLRAALSGLHPFPLLYMLMLSTWWAAATGTPSPMGALGFLRTIV